MNITPISSLDHVELEPYRTLRGRTHHWQEGFCVVEGEKAVRALLASTLQVHSLLMSEEWLRVLQPELLGEQLDDAVVYVADGRLLEDIVGFSLHKRLLAIGGIPPNPTLEEVHAAGETAPGRLAVHVALEGIADAENMGMILRNCAAFGVASLLVGPDSCNPWLRRSIRVSLGNVFSLTIHRSANILDTLRQCHAVFGWRIVAATPRGGDSTITPRADGSPLCLLFGSEADGLSEGALSVSDARFTVPMRNGVDSINVANAVAVALYAAMR
jgi:tRNA G18 (ribose-2'-O)-methylase SpoU